MGVLRLGRDLATEMFIGAEPLCQVPEGVPGPFLLPVSWPGMGPGRWSRALKGDQFSERFAETSTPILYSPRMRRAFSSRILGRTSSRIGRSENSDSQRSGDM